MALHRSQILLEERQYQALVRMAATKEVSISEVARRLIDIGLGNAEDLAERRLDALAQLEELRTRQERKHGIGSEDPVEQARLERADALL